jgi:putative transposase
VGRKATQANAENCSIAELDVACAAAPSRGAHDRLRAIKSLILGIDHDMTAEVFNVSRRTLFNWIKRFNEAGIDGLLDRTRSGRPRKIALERAATVRDRFEHPETLGQRHWTARKFHGYLNETVGLEVGYSTVVRWLHEQDFRLKVPQPWPDRQDEQLREAFVARLRHWLKDAEIDLWFQDEMGVEGDPRPRRRWAKKGEKTRGTKNGDHIRLNASGMICPRTGEAFVMSFTHSDRECFQLLLDQANQTVRRQRRRNLLIMDNAGWHKCKSLRWGRFEPIYLPPYSPDLNPIERLWLLIKSEWFTGYIAKTRDELWDHLDKALVWAMDRTRGNQQTCSIKKKL